MTNFEKNRIRARREARGLSQVALAAAAQLTRQSISSIETGRSLPAVDVALRLAKALDCRVEDLFGDPASEAELSTVSDVEHLEGRVAVAEIAGRWVSYPLDRDGVRKSADALVASTQAAGRVAVEPLRPEAELRQNVVLMGCATGLSLLADRLNARPGPGRFHWVSASSTAALDALAHSRTHLAGVHLVDPKTGEANVRDVRRLRRGKSLALVTLARWEAGLLTAPGNPKRLRGAADLARRGLRIAVREQGAGARRLLDEQLKSAGISIDLTASKHPRASGHLEVARALSLNAADVGVATRDAALAFGLDFVPLAEERYDLAIPLESLPDPRIERLFDVMTSAPLRRELASIGYDVSACGTRMPDIVSA